MDSHSGAPGASGQIGQSGAIVSHLKALVCDYLTETGSTRTYWSKFLYPVAMHFANIF
jgi:hypothetical protein